MLKCLCFVVTLLWRKIPAESVNWSTAECKHSLILTFTRQQLAETMSKFSRHTTQSRAEYVKFQGDAATMCCASIDFILRMHFAVGCFCGSWLWNVLYSHLLCSIRILLSVRRIVLSLCEASRDGIAKMPPSTVRDTTALTDTQCCIDHDWIIPHAD